MSFGSEPSAGRLASLSRWIQAEAAPLVLAVSCNTWTMTPDELTDYLHDAIPLSASMGARAIGIEPGSVIVEAPLAPNLNHRGTVFGGSLSTLAILAGFSVVLLGLRAGGYEHRVVIHRNEYDYLLPAAGTFTATARLDDQRWSRFIETVRRRDRGRITIDADVSCGSLTVGHLSGTFAALQPPQDEISRPAT